MSDEITGYFFVTLRPSTSQLVLQRAEVPDEQADKITVTFDSDHEAVHVIREMIDSQMADAENEATENLMGMGPYG